MVILYPLWSWCDSGAGSDKANHGGDTRWLAQFSHQWIQSLSVIDWQSQWLTHWVSDTDWVRLGGESWMTMSSLTSVITHTHILIFIISYTIVIVILIVTHYSVIHCPKSPRDIRNEWWWHFTLTVWLWVIDNQSHSLTLSELVIHDNHMTITNQWIDHIHWEWEWFSIHWE